MAKIVIGLVGEMASGKGVTKQYVESKYDARDCKFSTSLRDVLDRLFIEKSRDNLIDLSTILREKFGQDLLAKVIAHDAEKLDSEIVIIDGVRRLSDIEFLSKLPHFKLVRIEVDTKISYERMKLRNENIGDAEKTYEEFMQDHQKETERTIPEVMSKAEFSLDNNGTLEGLYIQIDDLLQKLLK